MLVNFEFQIIYVINWSSPIIEIGIDQLLREKILYYYYQIGRRINHPILNVSSPQEQYIAHVIELKPLVHDEWQLFDLLEQCMLLQGIH
jgi:hypothetical protein